MAVKVNPIQPVFRSFDKDERHAAEEKRIQLLLALLSEMDIPLSRIQFLKLATQRKDTLEWLRVNLSVYNSHHKNFSRAQNLIRLLLRSVT